MATGNSKENKLSLSEYLNAVTDTKLVQQIERHLGLLQKQSRIMAFRALGKSITLERVFLNYKDLEAVLGDTYNILLQAVHHAICDSVIETINRVIPDLTTQVGIWDQYSLYELCTKHIIYATDDDALSLPGLGRQLLVIHADVNSDEPIASCRLVFSEYSPANFCNFWVTAVLEVVMAMCQVIDRFIPKMLYNLKSSTNLDEWRCFVDAIQSDTAAFSDITAELDVTAPATDDLIREFCKSVEQPMLLIFAKMLRECGLSTETINGMFDASRVHILYGDPVDTQLGKITLDIRLVSKHNAERSVCYTSTIGAELAVHKTTMTKTAAMRYGKNMQKFIKSLCIYAINIYMDQKRSDLPQDMNEGETPQA